MPVPAVPGKDEGIDHDVPEAELAVASQRRGGFHIDVIGSLTSTGYLTLMGEDAAEVEPGRDRASHRVGNGAE